eukprot:CAMPEP_0175873744 /NCGR_PEP_ID=MMETSP0107_2-20121207/38489_1 /TAXON_ID=195067 ORGANISM="Goniomonas pacifica, Strain CCMP1869" /NCGR_SAMPLE_ID=MMETSP0107_2 /ASSEMBLY_ACC=CAM_ASM_000203 /LENGTH=206 /DNA_ID=CAMNT_0017192525 /DNA_START=11 /DNA_END=632 /DNA_ORIENTATION=+
MISVANCDRRPAASHGDLGRLLLQNRASHLAPRSYAGGAAMRPKGVTASFDSLEHQLEDLRNDWDVGPADHFVNCLRLDQVHGLRTGLLLPLWCGATVHLSRMDCIQPWDAVTAAWAILREERGSDTDQGALVLIVTPQMLNDLLKGLALVPPSERGTIDEAMAATRLVVCGTSQLPGSVRRRWEETWVEPHRVISDFPTFLLKGH